MRCLFVAAWVALSAIAVAAESIEPLPIEPLPIAEKILINGIEISTAKPPRGTAVRKQLGLLTVDALDGQVVHRTNTRILETHAAPVHASSLATSAVHDDRREGATTLPTKAELQEAQ